MPSYEAKLLADFLTVPASLRDFMTFPQFASIFPSAHRSAPAIKELYGELHALRERDIEVVRQEIGDEVKRSKQLKREYAKGRRQMDDANVSGINPFALQMEEEVCPCHPRATLSLFTYPPALRRSGQETAHATNDPR
jgi:centromere-localized protein 2